MTIGMAIPVTLLLCLDMMDDYRAGVSIWHLIIEVGFWTVGLTLIIFLLKGLNRAYRSVGALKRDLAKSTTEAERLRMEAKNLAVAGQSFEHQFGQWQLSPAERDVALLLLRGLSYQQIASSRNAAEGTVRQQALSVYRKAGLSGRSELAAFFLEDLLVSPPGNRNAEPSV